MSRTRLANDDRGRNDSVGSPRALLYLGGAARGDVGARQAPAQGAGDDDVDDAPGGTLLRELLADAQPE